MRDLEGLREEMGGRMDPAVEQPQAFLDALGSVLVDR